MKETPCIKDFLSGQSIAIYTPSAFVLETELVTTGYYRDGESEYRFRLSEARKAGLDISKTRKPDTPKNP